MRDVKYNADDVKNVFEAFRDHAKPIPYEVRLQHYSTIDERIPCEIDMESDHYLDLRKVFGLIQNIQTTLTILPGKQSLTKKRQLAKELIERTQLQWSSYQDDAGALKHATQSLVDLDNDLTLRLQRHELMLEVRSYRYSNFIE